VTPIKKTRKPRKTKSWGTQNVHRGIQYRSFWETYVAKLLLYSAIEFKYEPRRFYLSPTVSYLPDFYLPELNAYIEVKGWLLEKDKVKISLFKTKVTTRLIYLDKTELEEIFGASAAKISKLPFETFVPTNAELVRFQQNIKKQLRG
jgi:hypothetical protein